MASQPSNTAALACSRLPGPSQTPTAHLEGVHQASVPLLRAAVPRPHLHSASGEGPRGLEEQPDPALSRAVVPAHHTLQAALPTKGPPGGAAGMAHWQAAWSPWSSRPCGSPPAWASGAPAESAPPDSRQVGVHSSAPPPPAPQTCDCLWPLRGAARLPDLRTCASLPSFH